MGVYTRKDSKFYWVYLERKRGGKGTYESTSIPVRADRSVAEAYYVKRMVELSNNGPTHKARADGSGWCYVYFVSDGELVKIGRAVNVLARVRAMQTSSTRPLLVLATCIAHISVERRLHHHFRHLNRGREWFAPEPELLDVIERIKRGEDPVAELVNARTRVGPTT